MNREIKFRGISKDSKEWVYGFINYSPSRNEYYIMETVSSFPIPVIPETVGQYTNLKDKNGKEIYEGDVVRSTDKFSWEGTVIFEKGQFIVDRGTRWIPIWEDLEILSTIHDKELED